MPGKDSLIPAEWYAKAEEDLTAAKSLLSTEPGLKTISVFHIHQAVEKYLKGFLLSKGWKLDRVHDLVRLLGDLVVYDATFSKFDATCARLTEFYLESRYPLSPMTSATEEDVRQILAEAEEIISEIKQHI